MGGAGLPPVAKDVDGFMSADPKLVTGAHMIDILSYSEAAELAYFGAKILHPRIVQPVELSGIPIVIKNAYNLDGKGTIIKKEGYQKKDVIKRPGLISQVCGQIAPLVLGWFRTWSHGGLVNTK